MGDWIQTYSGLKFDLEDIESNEFSIVDIAHSLSLQCRYNGHSLGMYSVSQHSVLASYIAPKELKLTALLHDCSEAYLSDLPRPVKRLPQIYLSYKELEERILKAALKQFGGIYPLPDEIHQIDNDLLVTEQHYLMTAPPEPWSTNGKFLKNVLINPWPSWYAEDQFIKKFVELIKG